MSQVKFAAAKYAEGNYAAALEIYKKLGSILGEEYFSVNIYLCKQRMEKSGSLEVDCIDFGSKSLTSLLSLKSYTKQSTLVSIAKENAVSLIEKKDDIYIEKNKSFSFKQIVSGGESYVLSLTCTEKNGGSKKGAVVDISFSDKDGKILPKPYQGMSKSSAFGSYVYIETQESVGATPEIYKFTSPKGASQIHVDIVAFGVKSGMTLSGNYYLKSSSDYIKTCAGESKYLETFEVLLEEAKLIPDSNGSEYFTKHDFRVGVIGDVYMYNFYKDVFSTVHYLSPDNYQEILGLGLDIVIYTTCWKGVNNDEWRGVKFREKPKRALDNIIDFSKKNNIKTVFQTIEDPSNFEYFLPVAKNFDYIFTTDTDCIDRYKEALGHEKVFFGEYGVNPQFNNPIGSRRKIRNAAFFAGSYPMRYKERCDDMEVIFDSIINSGGELLIADRNFGVDSEELVYPERFRSSVLPPVQHALLQKLHKLFRYNLNFNSIKQSPTMCAMRVYELQAQGNGFISNYANSVFNKFPGVRIVPYKQDMSFDFGRDETWEEYRQNIGNIREVLDTKTSYQVVSRLLGNIGLAGVEKKLPTILVICAKKTEVILNSFEQQIYSKKILIEESELGNWEAIRDAHEIGYFCWFSHENNYEKYYLNDLVNGFKYTDCQYITKNSYFDSNGNYVAGPEHEYTSKCSGKAMSLFSAKYMEPEFFSSSDMHQSFELENGYSVDPFELNFVRYIQKTATPPVNYKLSVIVPVYNNGRFLVSKCIPSLQRNKLWSEMEILLVDDGSSETSTLKTLDELKALYPNVRVKLNHDGGSGSASRPRNQGLDMAAAPLITFLDPDNEIAPGAYDLLMDLYSEANATSSEPVEFVSGFHVKVAEDVKAIGKHTPKRLSVIKDFRKGYFDRGRFPVVATQSAVISKKFLDSNRIRFVERSAGQDTLFGWELIAKARCAAFNGDAYIIYYADRSDSITNKIDKSYFEKKLILEREQVKFLKNSELFENFKDNHFDRFMKEWYLVKLRNIVKEDYSAAVDLLGKICDLYGKNINFYI